MHACGVIGKQGNEDGDFENCRFARGKSALAV